MLEEEKQMSDLCAGCCPQGIFKYHVVWQVSRHAEDRNSKGSLSPAGEVGGEVRMRRHPWKTCSEVAVAMGVQAIENSQSQAGPPRIC